MRIFRRLIPAQVWPYMVVRRADGYLLRVEHIAQDDVVPDEDAAVVAGRGRHRSGGVGHACGSGRSDSPPRGEATWAGSTIRSVCSTASFSSVFRLRWWPCS